MCKKTILTILVIQILSLSASSQGFLKTLAGKAANAGGDLILNKAKNKASKGLDKAVDGQPGKKADTVKTGSVGYNDESTGNKAGADEKKLASAQSRFDFVPGEKLILFDNFEQDVAGEFPLKWFTNGSGEVVKLDNQQGKWLQFNSGSFLSPVAKMPENFTMEFDLFLNLTTKSSAVLPGFGFEFFDRGDKAKRLDAYNYTLNNLLTINNHFSYDKAVAQLDSRENKNQKMKSDKIFLMGFQNNFGTIVHVAVSVQKERMRLWYNQEKVLDMPTAVAVPHNFNQVRFYGDKTREGYPGFYITNFKIAAGLPDLENRRVEFIKL